MFNIGDLVELKDVDEISSVDSRAAQSELIAYKGKGPFSVENISAGYRYGRYQGPMRLSCVSVWAPHITIEDASEERFKLYVRGSYESYVREHKEGVVLEPDFDETKGDF